MTTNKEERQDRIRKFRELGHEISPAIEKIIEAEIELTLHQHNNLLIEKIEGMIEAELNAPPADNLEKTAEWYKVTALKEVLSIIKESGK